MLLIPLQLPLALVDKARRLPANLHTPLSISCNFWIQFAFNNLYIKIRHREVPGPSFHPAVDRMLPPVMRCSKGPIIGPFPLRTKINADALLEDMDLSCDSLSSTSDCQSCPSPLTLETLDSVSAAPTTSTSQPDQEQSPRSLAELLLQTLEKRSATPDCVQTTAVVPWDQRVVQHWELIDLLCQRTFAAFWDQACIRNFNMYYYQHVRPGKRIITTARRVTQNGLVWLEATVTTDNILVATGNALYDEMPGTALKQWTLNLGIKRHGRDILQSIANADFLYREVKTYIHLKKCKDRMTHISYPSKYLS